MMVPIKKNYFTVHAELKKVKLFFFKTKCISMFLFNKNRPNQIQGHTI